MKTATANRLQPQQDQWLGEPVVERWGIYNQMTEATPLFDRRPFGLYTGPPASDELAIVTGENSYYDIVGRWVYSSVVTPKDIAWSEVVLWHPQCVSRAETR